MYQPIIPHYHDYYNSFYYLISFCVWKRHRGKIWVVIIKKDETKMNIDVETMTTNDENIFYFDRRCVFHSYHADADLSLK